MENWTLIATLNTFGLYIGILFANGAFYYRLIFETSTAQLYFSTKKTIVAFVWLAIVCVGLSYSLKAINLTGEINSAFDTELLSILWQTPIGTVFIQQLCGLVLIYCSLFFSKIGVFFGIIGSLLTLSSFTYIGHTSGDANIWLKPLLFVHLFAISVWMGILLPLIKLSQQIEAVKTTVEIARKFSKLASFFVPLLILCGGILSVKLVGSIDNLFNTEYGQGLLWKILTISAVLLLALFNKIKFAGERHFSHSNASHKTFKTLRISIVIESLLIAIVLFVTAIITNFFAAPNI